MSKQSWEIDRKGREYCESCRRDVNNTVCALCLQCSRQILDNQRRLNVHRKGKRARDLRLRGVPASLAAAWAAL